MFQRLKRENGLTATRSAQRRLRSSFHWGGEGRNGPSSVRRQEIHRFVARTWWSLEGTDRKVQDTAREVQGQDQGKAECCFFIFLEVPTKHPAFWRRHGWTNLDPALKELTHQGLPRWHSGKESAWRPGFDPWAGKIPWRRKWQSTPVLLPGKSHGRKSLAGYRPWDHKESDTTEQMSTHTHTHTHTHAVRMLRA